MLPAIGPARAASVPCDDANLFVVPIDPVRAFARCPQSPHADALEDDDPSPTCRKRSPALSPDTTPEYHARVGGRTNPSKQEPAMKLTSTQVEQTLNQFQAEPIPDHHPVIAQLSRLFGEHTFFLDGNGLNIVEPQETDENQGQVINLATWTDADQTSLTPHPPEATEVTVKLVSH
jgi:hypothetical protein